MDLYSFWKKVRECFPQDKRLLVFTELVSSLEDVGWDQGGYIYEYPKEWEEVHEYCNRRFSED